MYVTAKKCPKSIGQRALNKGHARNPTLIQQLTFSKNISKIDLWRLNFQKPFRFFFLHAKRLVSDDSYVITSFVLIAKSNSILVVAVAFLILFFHRRDLKFDVKQYSVESDWVIYIGHLDTPRELETSKGVPDRVKKKNTTLRKADPPKIYRHSLQVFERPERNCPNCTQGLYEKSLPYNFRFNSKSVNTTYTNRWARKYHGLCWGTF